MSAHKTEDARLAPLRAELKAGGYLVNAYRLGRAAGNAGLPPDVCPYTFPLSVRQFRDAWRKGDAERRKRERDARNAAKREGGDA